MALHLVDQKLLSLIVYPNVWQVFVRLFTDWLICLFIMSDSLFKVFYGFVHIVTLVIWTRHFHLLNVHKNTVLFSLHICAVCKAVTMVTLGRHRQQHIMHVQTLHTTKLVPHSLASNSQSPVHTLCRYLLSHTQAWSQICFKYFFLSKL